MPIARINARMLISRGSKKAGENWSWVVYLEFLLMVDYRYRLPHVHRSSKL
jgi:hypothetical protein